PGNAAPAAAPDGRLPAAEDEQLALDDVAGISELAKCFFSAHKVPVQDDATSYLHVFLLAPLLVYNATIGGAGYYAQLCYTLGIGSQGSLILLWVA
uniref:Uncharacterized protein n=1 Tax=Oryza glaberrima TaxID=4538 RepID=I1R819_ORYGL